MEMDLAISILTLTGITIFLGYIGSLIFEKTKIPDVVWLLIFGLMVGPIFGLIDRTIFLAISPLLASVALLIILFDAGLNMNFYTMVKEFPRAITLSLLGMALSMISVGLISMYFFGFNLLTGLLLGAIVGGTSSPIVISTVSNLKIREHVKTLLELESILTDPICIVLAIALLQVITTSLANSIAHDIIASFSIAIVIGALSGLAWLLILHLLRKRPFGYMLTLAMLMIMYVFVETVAGSGAIAALFFGIVLGNGKIITGILKFEKKLSIKPFIKTFHKEMSFFIRSFFFVYLGLIVSISPKYVIYGVVISAVLILLRLLTTKISMIGTDLTKVEMNIIKIMTPRGLAAAVLAQLPLQAGIAGGSMISSIVFVVILCTVIYSSIAMRFMYTPDETVKKIDVKKNQSTAKRDKIIKKESKLQEKP